MRRSIRILLRITSLCAFSHLDDKKKLALYRRIELILLKKRWGESLRKLFKKYFLNLTKKK